MQAIETENQHALSVFLHPESESNRYLEIPSRCVCVCVCLAVVDVIHVVISRRKYMKYVTLDGFTH